MKHIIKNKSQLSPQDSLMRVISVMDKGKISTYNGTHGYCYVTRFEDCHVIVNLTRSGTHTFEVSDL